MNVCQRLILVALQISLLMLIVSPVTAEVYKVPVTVKLGKTVILQPQKRPAKTQGGDDKEQREIRYSFAAVANPDIVDIPKSYKPTYLQMNAKKIGTTDVLVWEEGVKDPTMYTVTVVGDDEAIEGRIRELAPKDSIRAQFVGDTLVLSGTVANEITAKKAEEIAKVYTTKVINHITVDTPLQVLLQVKVAQVDKTSLKKLGLSAIVKGSNGEGFSNLVGAPSTLGNTLSNRIGTSTSSISSAPGINGSGPSGLGGFDPLDTFQLGVSHFPSGVGAVLQALSTKGLAKILAEPNLLVRSGQEGDFLAGSKIPYTVLVSTGGAATSSIVFETVGIKLKFKPNVLENGLIDLKIDPAEVSSIAGTLAVNGYPIIDTRDVRTSVELRDGESLVLAGLLQEDKIKIMSKIPILGDIPVLGALFRSTQDEIRDKELVFFITPKIIQAFAPGVQPDLPTDLAPDPDEVRELNWMPLGE